MKNFLYVLALVLIGTMYSNAHESDNSGLLYHIDNKVNEVASGSKITIKENELFHFINPSNAKYVDLTQSADEAVQFEVDRTLADQVFSYKNKYVELEGIQFPDGSSKKLVLIKTKPIYDANTKFIANGKEITMPIIDSYFGFVQGAQNSTVYLSEFNGSLTGVIETSEGKFNIGKVFGQTNSDNYHVIKKYNTVIDPESGITFCGVDDNDINPDMIPEISAKDIEDAKNAEGFLEVKLTAAGTYDYLRIVASRENSLSGSATPEQYLSWEADIEKSEPIFQQAIVYMTQVLEMTSRIYERQANVMFSLQTIVQYGSDDPMIDIQLPGQREPADVKLNRMPEIWNSRTDDSHYVVLFNNSSVPGSNILGIAMSGQPRVGNFCNIQRSYCVVGVGYNYREFMFENSGDVHTTAHELGHLFGSPHTHNCYWWDVDPQPSVRDTCVTTSPSAGNTADACITNGDFRVRRNDGTIMSYCHIGGSVITDFHPYIASNLLSFAARRAQCVDNPEEPIVRLTNHLGRETLSTGFELIEWRSHGITQVDLAYSIDGGEFQTIATGLNAGLGEFRWDVPDVSTDNLIVEIYESGNRQPGARTYDASLIGVSVQNQFISITAPEELEKVGNKYQYVVTWESNLVENVKIEFGTNGSDWEEIGTSSGNQFIWNPTGEVVGDGYLRLTSLENGSISDVVNFKMGAPDGQFTAPTEDGYICLNGENYGIAFDAEYVRFVTIEYSLDNGATYRNLTPLTPLSIDIKETKEYYWPQVRDNGLTDDYRLRLSAVNPSGDRSVLDEISINMVECEASVEENLSNNQLSILNIRPNPVDNIASIDIVSDVLGNELNIQIADLTGRIIYSTVQNSNQQFETIELNLENLAVGSYILTVSNGSYSDSQTLKINR